MVIQFRVQRVEARICYRPLRPMQPVILSQQTHSSLMATGKLHCLAALTITTPIPLTLAVVVVPAVLAAAVAVAVVMHHGAAAAVWQQPVQQLQHKTALPMQNLLV